MVSIYSAIVFAPGGEKWSELDKPMTLTSRNARVFLLTRRKARRCKRVCGGIVHSMRCHVIHKGVLLKDRAQRR